MAPPIHPQPTGTTVRDHPLAQTIRSEARALGFSQVRFCDAAPPAGLEAYDTMLAEGRHGELAWMERGRAARAEPARLLPGVRSVVVLGVAHAWPRPVDPGGLTGKVASYAWGRDYHNLVGKRLRKLAARLRQLVPGLGLYGGVDSRPLHERAWAERAGLAYIGRNCCAIVPGQGSYRFLAVMLVNQELPPDPPLATAVQHCGSCHRCLEACPTDAFVGPHRLDARRCLSYLSIELKGPIPVPLRLGMGRWVFGCDLCQEVCPHNHAPPTSLERDLAPIPGRAWLNLPWVLSTPDADLEAALWGSPLRRPGARGLKRNAAVVLGNLGDRAALPVLEQARKAGNPLVAEHAAWALERLG